jgi:uncharacterized protein YaaN involved in tellurite resistance
MTDPAALPALAVAEPPTTLALLPDLRLPVPAVSRGDFSAEENAKVAEIAGAVQIADTATIMTFGAPPQQRMSRYLDQLLGDRTIGQAGVGGEIALEISRGIDRMNLRKMRLELDGKDWVAATLGGLPLVGRYFSALRAFYFDRKRIVDEFDRIETRAQQDKDTLIAATANFDGLVRQLEVLLRELAVHLAAGEQVLDQARGKFQQERAALAAIPLAERDPARAARLQDLGERIAQFDVRLVNLHSAYLQAVQAIPEVRMVSKASEIEIQNVMESILTDIPRLKRAVLQMVSLEDLRRARAGTAQRKELSREIGELAARGTREAYTEAKRSQGDFADDLAHLDKVAAELMGALAEGARLDKENEAKRAAARTKLAEMKNAFVAQLSEVQRVV